MCQSLEELVKCNFFSISLDNLCLFEFDFDDGFNWMTCLHEVDELWDQLACK